MAFLRSLVILATFLFAGSASAAELGELGVGDPISFAGSVPDELTFGLSADGTVGISLTNVFLTISGQTFNEIQNFSASILNAGDDSSVADLTYSSDTSGPATIQLLVFSGVLGQGQYKLAVTGDVRDGEKATYGGVAVAAPVPVPAAVWLLGSALVGMVSIRRRAA